MTEEIVSAVAAAVARADGVRPADLDYGIDEYVDPAVFEGLAGHADWELTVGLPDHEVTVRHTGEILVDGDAARVDVEFGTGRDGAPGADGGGRSRYRETAVERAPGVICYWRNERGWPVAYASDGARELLGYDAAALADGEVGYGSDVVHPGDRDAVRRHVRAALDDRESFRLTHRIRRPGGDPTWVFAVGTGVYEASLPVGVVGFVTELPGLVADGDATAEG